MIRTRLALAGLFAFSAFAQTYRGNLDGVATDASGAVLQGATLTLSSPSTGLTRAAVSSAKGDFLFVDLPVGIYTLTISDPGFQTKKIDNIEVAVSKTTDITVQLGVAQQQSTVEVAASAVPIDTTSSSLTTAVNTTTHCCPAKLWVDSITVFESAS
jgi:hypothetical protein